MGTISGLPKEMVCRLLLNTESNSTGLAFHPARSRNHSLSTHTNNKKKIQANFNFMHKFKNKKLEKSHEKAYTNELINVSRTSFPFLLSFLSLKYLRISITKTTLLLFKVRT